MIDLLMRLHTGKELLLDMAIDPGQVEIKIRDGFDYEVPFHLLSDMLDHRVLSF